MLYLGIDQHRKQLTVNLRNEAGEIVLRTAGEHGMDSGAEVSGGTAGTECVRKEDLWRLSRFADSMTGC